jgi:hypothetical protein
LTIRSKIAASCAWSVFFAEETWAAAFVIQVKARRQKVIDRRQVILRFFYALSHVKSNDGGMLTRIPLLVAVMLLAAMMLAVMMFLCGAAAAQPPLAIATDSLPPLTAGIANNRRNPAVSLRRIEQRRRARRSGAARGHIRRFRWRS